MKNYLIYWPVLAQLAIPIFVLLLNGKRKGDAKRAGEVDPNSPINNTAWPLPVVLTSNSLANQFQLPIIFYVLCFILAGTAAISSAVLSLCWIFVALRYIHAFVHVTSNYIPARFFSFLASTLTLIGLFVVTIVHLSQLT